MEKSGVQAALDARLPAEDCITTRRYEGLEIPYRWDAGALVIDVEAMRLAAEHRRAEQVELTDLRSFVEYVRPYASARVFVSRRVAVAVCDYSGNAIHLCRLPLVESEEVRAWASAKLSQEDLLKVLDLHGRSIVAEGEYASRETLEAFGRDVAVVKIEKCSAKRDRRTGQQTLTILGETRVETIVPGEFLVRCDAYEGIESPVTLRCLLRPDTTGKEPRFDLHVYDRAATLRGAVAALTERVRAELGETTPVYSGTTSWAP